MHACLHTGFYLLLSRHTYKSAGQLSEYFPSNLILRGWSTRALPRTFLDRRWRCIVHAIITMHGGFLWSRLEREIRIFREIPRIVTALFRFSLLYMPITCLATKKFLYKTLRAATAIYRTDIFFYDSNESFMKSCYIKYSKYAYIIETNNRALFIHHTAMHSPARTIDLCHTIILFSVLCKHIYTYTRAYAHTLFPSK